LEFGESSEQRILNIFRDVLAIAADDGVRFDRERSTRQSNPRGAASGCARRQPYPPLASPLLLISASATPLSQGREQIEYPVLLDMPMPKLRGYARETVITEKFQAMVAFGRTNSRMKDFYDIWILSRTFHFAEDRLGQAIASTFAHRRTAIPTDTPDALTPAFAQNPLKQRQWTAFVIDLDDAPTQLQVVTDALAGSS
jgi:hypothetical protein